MKKRFIFLALFVVLFVIPFMGGTVKAQQLCNLLVTQVNQDPYPVIPGDYVELVYQVAGVENVKCGQVTFELPDDFPIEFDPDDTGFRTILSGTFSEAGFATGWMIPYRVRIHEDALEGNNSMDIRYSASGSGQSITKTFYLEIEDVRTDFSVSIANFEANNKNSLTFEILNIGENDAEAVTVFIPQQPNINVKGNQQNIIGSLDAFEDTTFSFEAFPQPGDINLQIRYIDEIGELRTLNKFVNFNPNFYIGRAGEGNGSSTTTYIIIIGVVLVLSYFVFKYYSNKKRKKKLKL